MRLCTHPCTCTNVYEHACAYTHTHTLLPSTRAPPSKMRARGTQMMTEMRVVYAYTEVLARVLVITL